MDRTRPAMSSPIGYSKTVGQVRSGIEFAAAHVNRAGRGFSKRHDPRIEAVNEGAEREKVKMALVGYAQRNGHMRTLTLSVDSMQCQEIIEKSL
jgi:hypothetical protein